LPSFTTFPTSETSGGKKRGEKKRRSIGGGALALRLFLLSCGVGVLVAVFFLVQGKRREKRAGE